MPGIIVFALDMDKDVGERLAPEVIAEIQAVAPSVVVDGSITTVKLDEKAVTTNKLADGAVTSPKIATGGVDTVNLADAAVTTPKLADGAVTAPKAGIGVVKSVDADDEPIASTHKYVTTTEYAGIVSPDPNVTYFISAG